MSIKKQIQLDCADSSRRPAVSSIMLTWTPPRSPFEGVVSIASFTEHNLQAVLTLVSDVEYTYKQHIKDFREKNPEVMKDFGARQEALLVVYRLRSREQLKEKPDWKEWRVLAEKEVKIRVRQMVWMDLKMIID